MDDTSTMNAAVLNKMDASPQNERISDDPLERARAITDEIRNYKTIVIFSPSASCCERLIFSEAGEFLLNHYSPHFVFPPGVQKQLTSAALEKLQGNALSEIPSQSGPERENGREPAAEKQRKSRSRSAIQGSLSILKAGASQFASNPLRQIIAVARNRRKLRESIRRLNERIYYGSQQFPASDAIIDLLNEIDPLFVVVPICRRSESVRDFLQASREARIVSLLMVQSLIDHQTARFVAKSKYSLNIAKMSRQDALNALASISRDKLERDGGKSRLTRANLNRGLMANAYGANRIMTEYCGLESIHEVPDYWMHGWIPEYHNVHPEFVALHKLIDVRESLGDRRKRIEVEKATHPQFVSREDQATYLRQYGYDRACAIGLPFAYLPDVAVERKDKSLLVMPPHGRYRHGPGDPFAEAYAEYIESKHDRFSSISVVLTAGDYVSREWVSAFERRGIEVLVGAHHGEPQTLLRQKALLCSVEYVTTNGFGSHIAYAAACGCKVSVAGQFAEWDKDRLSRVFAVKTYPHLLPAMTRLHSEQALKEAFPFLFVEPEDAEQTIEWGKIQIGADYIKTPEEITSLFGWRP